VTAWKRWQDWATILLGVIVFATPFVFGVALDSAAAYTAYAAGVLLALSGIWTASTSEPNPGIEWIPAIVGAALFVAPWFVSYTHVPEMSWMSWIVGALVVLNSGAELLVTGQRPTTA
jgi:uncharacterized membrane protein HdeD (DUF308 family)